MNGKTAASALETAANILVIAALLIAGVVYFRGHTTAPPESSPAVRLQRGDLLPNIGLYEFRKPKTVLLMLSTGCHYCEASKPFYASLQERWRRVSAEVDLIAVLPEDREAVSRFLPATAWEIPIFAAVSLRRLHVYGTPTIAVVDQQGTVLEVWNGQISESAQERVLDRIFGSGS